MRHRVSETARRLAYMFRVQGCNSTCTNSPAAGRGLWQGVCPAPLLARLALHPPQLEAPPSGPAHLPSVPALGRHHVRALADRWLHG